MQQRRQRTSETHRHTRCPVVLLHSSTLLSLSPRSRPGCAVGMAVRMKCAAGTRLHVNRREGAMPAPRDAWSTAAHLQPHATTWRPSSESEACRWCTRAAGNAQAQHSRSPESVSYQLTELPAPVAGRRHSQAAWPTLGGSDNHRTAHLRRRCSRLARRQRRGRRPGTRLSPCVMTEMLSLAPRSGGPCGESS